ncbi:hypothetical protein BB560_001713 [Smittium megazygosporum]|uniref:Condensin complex subunit 2 n=1 Tax=Smittium megazygosporum TaxID=133381 RepID=A0A2T9ZGT9_9FUNG|nr:hypothetical protein BB560_001713 [Smittium megazygosporum]
MAFITPSKKKRNVSSIVTPKPNSKLTATATPNDDAKERRLRRKSAMERRRTEFTTPRSRELAASMKALSRIEEGEFIDPGLLSSAEKSKVNIPQLTPEELNRRFEEWMKIAADNKINMYNTWDFALIDYFHDMRLLKDGGKINFQKASCTLDGCVKIYSSRVDSVATETGKLLTGLTDSQVKGSTSDDEDSEYSKKKSRKRVANTANTLAPDSASLNLKKFDLELTADPLYRKACSLFDEGGTGGLLLNNLDADNNGKLLFDAGQEAEFEKEDLDSEMKDRTPTEDEESQFDPIDGELTLLINNIITDMEDKEIAPLLQDYVLEKDESLNFDAIMEKMNDFTEQENEIDDELETLNNDADFEVNNIDDFLNFGESDAIDATENENENDLYQEKVLGTDLDEEEQSLEFGPPEFNFDTESNFFSYFDSDRTKNWAGPGHWKVSLPKGNVKKTTENDISASSAKATKAKKPKQVFLIDFNSENKLKTSEIFEEPKKLSQLNLPKSLINKTDEHTLPVDMRFNSKKVFSLFLKPTLEFRAHKSDVFKKANNSTRIANNPTEAGEFKVDGEDYTDFNAFGDDFDEDFDQAGLGDQEDDKGLLDISSAANANKSMIESILNNENGVLNEGELPKVKVIKPLYLQYAKVSKRVDVKRLKDNIWKGLSNEVPESQDTDPAQFKEPKKEEVDPDEMMVEEDIIPKSEKQTHKFSEVVEGLKESYPKEKLEDISVPFCFICLLHLANEKNLEIKTDQDINDLVIMPQ